MSRTDFIFQMDDNVLHRMVAARRVPCSFSELATERTPVHWETGSFEPAPAGLETVGPFDEIPPDAFFAALEEDKVASSETVRQV